MLKQILQQNQKILKRKQPPKKNVSTEKHSEVIVVDNTNSTTEQVPAENLGSSSTEALFTATPTKTKGRNKKQSPLKNIKVGLQWLQFSTFFTLPMGKEEGKPAFSCFASLFC